MSIQTNKALLIISQTGFWDALHHMIITNLVFEFGMDFKKEEARILHVFSLFSNDPWTIDSGKIQKWLSDTL